MIYIKNITEAQEVFIPRNDGKGNYVSPYEEGYEKGYQDGLAECGDCNLQEKNVNINTETATIVPDRDYDGLSMVRVNASGYGQTQYQSGITEGINEQKAKLSSTGFTQNGEYTNQDGWSAVTVDVSDIPAVLQAKELPLNSGFTGSTVTPDSGYDGLSEVRVYDNGYGEERYNAGQSAGETIGEATQKAKLTSTAFTENGVYTREDGWNSVEVDVPTGTSCNLQAKSVSMTAQTETFYPDSGSTGSTVIGIQTDGYCWFDTGIIPDWNTEIEIDFTPLNRSFISATQRAWGGIIGSQNGDDDNTTFQIRYRDNSREIIGRVGNGGDTSSVAVTYGNRYLVSLNKDYFTVDGTQYPTNASSIDNGNNTLYISCIHNEVQHHTWVNYRATPNIFHNVKIWQNGTLVRNFIPALDGSDVPCFYEEVNDEYVYNIGSGTCSAITETTGGTAYDGMSAITVSASAICQDSYNSGVTVGEDNVRSAMTSTAFTQNDTYTNASGWSSVTVNVPPTVPVLGDKKVLMTAVTQTFDHSFTRPTVSGKTVYGGRIDEWETLIDEYGNIHINVYTDSAHTSNTGVVYVENYNNEYEFYDFQSDNHIPFSSLTATWLGVGQVWGQYIYAMTDGENVFFYSNFSEPEHEIYVANQGLTLNDLILEEYIADGLNTIEVDAHVLISTITAIGMYKTTDGRTYNGEFRKRKTDTTGYTDCPVMSNIYIDDYGYYFFDASNKPIRIGLGGFSYEDTPSRLVYLRVPDSVDWIGDFAFENCTNLSELVLPSGFTDFSFSSVEGCSALTKIVSYAPTAPYISGQAGGSRFNISQSGIMYVPNGSDYSAWASVLPTGWTISATL